MHESVKEDKPNVPVPAPIIMGVFLMLGELLEWQFPGFEFSSTILFVLGWVLQVTATVILLWCFALFLRRQTTILPANAVSALVIEGPYRISRNPMYLALGLFHLGIASATGNFWSVLTFIPMIVMIRVAVIAQEEFYLKAKFGSTYQAYCEQVRRWI